ncbi:MAG: SusC/RagA family TonB-linked outer membrane protein [Bacteroidales bacterium]|nr:SusC/RagA family TonB-linked outer membrane protein [Bacteroidales bacterium]
MKTLKYLRIYSLVLILIAFGTQAFGQEVSGVIKNSKNKVLFGYVIKNSQTGDETITGKKGEFSINASAGQVLEVFYKGSKIDEIEVEGENAIYTLYENPFIKHVDGAYGKINRSTSSAAMDVLTADRIESTSFTNTHHTAIGQLAGLTTVQNGGEPGSNGVDFYVRGLNSFRDASPLILVDGFTSDFEHLSNFEIESITVLKDAVATAMYGLRASNGVILVTTKRGRIGKTSLKVNADYGVMMPTTLPDYVDAYTYSTMVNEAHANDGLAPRYTQQQLDGYKAGGDPYNYPNVDWQDEMLKSSANYMNTSLEFRGGSKRVQYYSLISYMHADGLFKHTDENSQYSTANEFNRINFRTNADIELNSRFDLQLGIGGRLENRNDPQVGTTELINNIFSTPANRYVMYNENGSFGGSDQYRNNPMAQMVGKGYNDKHSRYINFNVRLNYDLDFIAKGLSASAEGSFNNTFIGTEKFKASYTVYDRVLVPQPDGSTAVTYVPYGQEETIKFDDRSTQQDRTETFRGYLAYNQEFGNHSVNAMLVYDQSKLVYRNDAEPYNFKGVSARANYGFKNKYFVDVVASYNGTNSYNPDNQYGFFPAIGAAWVLSSEDFLNDNSWIDYLKLRTSYGITGSSLLDGYGRFSYLPNYGGNGSYRFGRTADQKIDGLSEKSIVNPDVEWEKGHQFNIGFDAVLFNKLNVSVDYFNEKKTDILHSINTIATDMVGIDVPQYNYGEVKNSGFDATLSYTNHFANGFSWFAEGNIGFAKNEVTKAYQQANDPTPMVGESISVIYGYEANGFYQDATDIANSPVNTLHPVQPGDVKYKDIAGNDNLINEYDRTAVGNWFPEMHYGITVGAELKGIYLTAAFDGIAKRDIMLNDHSMYRPLKNGYDNISEYAANNHWTPERGNSATLPRLSVSDNYNNYLPSSLYLQDGSYLRLRTAEIGYKFNTNVLERIKLSGAKLYLRGHNLLVLSDIAGDLDPEVRTGHPLLKSFNVGLNVQF